MKCQAIELLQLSDRADEEKTRIKDDMLAAIDHFCALHSGLVNAADQATAGIRAMLLRKALVTETIMLDIWRTAGKHLPSLPAMPSISQDLCDSDTPESSINSLECDSCLDVSDYDCSDDDVADDDVCF
jgi:hypothetical protein